MTERNESQKLSVQINTVLFENLITIDVLLIKMYHLLHEYLKAPSSCPRYLHDNISVDYRDCYKSQVIILSQLLQLLEKL